MRRSLANRVNKLVDKTGYVDCGSTIHIIDDGRSETITRIDAAKLKAEADGRPIIEHWIVDDTGRATTRYDVKILGWRKI